MPTNEEQSRKQIRALFSEYIENVLKPKWAGNPNKDFDAKNIESWVKSNVAGDWSSYEFHIDPDGYGCGVEKIGADKIRITIPGASKPPESLSLEDAIIAPPPPPPARSVRSPRAAMPAVGRRIRPC